jgi:hypothetical protein
MCNTSGFRNYGREGSLEGRGDIHLQSGREGHVVVFLCEVLYLTFLAIMIRSGGKLRNNPPQDIRLL